jgi:acyl carrier protein
MTQDAVEHVRRLIATMVEPAPAGGRAPELDDAVDLRAQGLVDSLGFLQLIAALEVRLGCGIDFSGLDSEHLTVVGPLCRHVARIWAAQHA